MVVKVERQKRAHIYPEYQGRIKSLGQKHGIKTVQTLDDNYRPLVKAKLVSVPLTPCGLEVKGGKLHLLAS